MVGEYATSAGALELRNPAKLFVPIAWLIAGPVNPVGFFAHLPWNERSWDIDLPRFFGPALTWGLGVSTVVNACCDLLGGADPRLEPFA